MKEYYHKKNSVGTFLFGALSALAIGTYLFFGSKKARRNREKVDWWIEDAKEEIFEKIGKMNNITREKFDKIVDKVLKKYSQLKHLKNEKIDRIKEDVRTRWEEIQEEEDDE